jgi:hypothetical protein
MRSRAYDVTTTSAPDAHQDTDRPLRLMVSVTATTVSAGQNFAASAAQVGTTLVGATISTGPLSADRVPSSLARRIIASVWMVLPSPMSSASTPPSCRSHSRLSQ